jgi:hypothetical protein
MKKLFSVLVLLLAMNFLAAAGTVGWLVRTGRLDRDKIASIKALVFPPPATTQPAAHAANAATTQPAFGLETLLAQYAGRPPAEQLDYIRIAFDAQRAKLDQAQRSVQNLEQQVVAGQAQLTKDRAAFEAEKKRLAAKEQEATKLLADKGFQDSLALYQSLPPKTVKTLFMGLDDATIVQYVQAMESSAATKIMKEFKTPPEADRLMKVLERMRQPQVSAKE